MTLETAASIAAGAALVAATAYTIGTLAGLSDSPNRIQSVAYSIATSLAMLYLINTMSVVADRVRYI
jgi:hypothetical protein